MTSGRTVDSWHQRTSIRLSVLRTTVHLIECGVDQHADIARSAADAPDAAGQIAWAAHLRLPQHIPVTDSVTR